MRFDAAPHLDALGRADFDAVTAPLLHDAARARQKQKRGRRARQVHCFTQARESLGQECSHGALRCRVQAVQLVLHMRRQRMAGDVARRDQRRCGRRRRFCRHIARRGAAALQQAAAAGDHAVRTRRAGEQANSKERRGAARHWLLTRAVDTTRKNGRRQMCEGVRHSRAFPSQPLVGASSSRRSSTLTRVA